MPYVALKPMTYRGREIAVGGYVDDVCKKSLISCKIVKWVDETEAPPSTESVELPEQAAVKTAHEPVAQHASVQTEPMPFKKFSQKKKTRKRKKR